MGSGFGSLKAENKTSYAGDINHLIFIFLMVFCFHMVTQTGNNSLENTFQCNN